jgi:hypothetical protein
MTIDDRTTETGPQPGTEVIDRLCFTIQRQSATCLEFVKHGIEAEREECAKVAEAEMESVAAQGDQRSVLVVQRIAERIRARATRTEFVTTKVFRAG